MTNQERYVTRLMNGSRVEQTFTGTKEEAEQQYHQWKGYLRVAGTNTMYVQYPRPAV